MIRNRLKQAFLLLVVGITIVLALSAAEPDAYTPTTFLFERKSRLSADYMLAVLGRGDAATLTPAVKSIHEEVKAGLHDGELDVLKVNLTTLISTAESLIRSQESPDNPPFAENEFVDRFTASISDFNAALTEAPGAAAEASSTEEHEYVPPEHDQIYNEAKKDLLDAAYDLLYTLENK